MKTYGKIPQETEEKYEKCRKIIYRGNSERNPR